MSDWFSGERFEPFEDWTLACPDCGVAQLVWDTGWSESDNVVCKNCQAHWAETDLEEI